MRFRIGLKKSLLFLWVFLLLCLRPSIFGERYNLVVFVLLFTVSIFLLFIYRKNLIQLETRSFGLFALIMLLVSYLFIQGMLSGSPPIIVFNSCFLIASVSLLSMYILSLDNAFILKSFIYIHVGLSMSSIVTFLMFVAGGFGSSGLITLGTIDNFMNTTLPNGFEGEFYAYHHIFFPFTHSWSGIGLGGLYIPRLLGIYREAGMAQIFFFTAYFLTYVVELNRVKLVRNILLIGGLFTFSTAGVLSFLAGYLVLNFYPRQKIKLNLMKLLSVFIAIPVIVTAVLFTPDFGVLAKVNSISGNERIKSYQRSWDQFVESPLVGHGFFNDFEKNRDVNDDKFIDTLGLIGFIYQLGIVGLFLYSLPWIYSLYYFNNPKTYFVLMPCLLTLLVSQPSYIDMVVWFLLMIDFKSIIHSDTLNNNVSYIS